MMTANDLTRTLLADIPRWFPGSRVWRRNVGAGIPYPIVKKAIATGDFSNLRPLSFGLAGEPDLCGWLHWRGLGIRLGVEIKRKDKQSPEQIVMQNAMRKAGAIYIVARDAEQCRLDLTEDVARIDALLGLSPGTSSPAPRPEPAPPPRSSTRMRSGPEPSAGPRHAAAVPT